MDMFERPDTLNTSNELDLLVNPPTDVVGKDGRPDDAWVLEQETILNKKYPGRNLLLEYHSLDNKMHVSENTSETSPGSPTRPLDEWQKINS